VVTKALDLRTVALQDEEALPVGSLEKSERGVVRSGKEHVSFGRESQRSDRGRVLVEKASGALLVQVIQTNETVGATGGEYAGGGECQGPDGPNVIGHLEDAVQGQLNSDVNIIRVRRIIDGDGGDVNVDIKAKNLTGVSAD
jgi:hypothetical protein